jgi:hypothetical protein
MYSGAGSLLLNAVVAGFRLSQNAFTTLGTLEVYPATMRAWIHILVVAFIAGLWTMVAACGGSSTAPTRSTSLDLTGTWSGQVGQPGSTSALRVTWVATHTGNIVSGIATVVKPAFNVQGRGAMTGILNGDRLILTYAVPPDSIPGFSRCEIAGIGNATASSISINGGIGLMFTSCEGTGLERPGSDELRLTR